MKYRLEEVFKTNGVPTHTFVEPKEWTRLVLGLRTPGRGIVIEGPSGIGKTTAVKRALEEEKLDKNALFLSARRQADLEYIDSLPDMEDIGTVVVDDFHKLDQASKRKLADYMKLLADEEAFGSKLVVVGINKAGDSLVQFADDIALRIETIHFESNPDDKVAELISRGENALNIAINVKDDVVISAKGGFYIAQMLCSEVCEKNGILESQDRYASTRSSFEAVKAEVWDRLSRRFKARTEQFCRGTKFRREGRAPYLHMLYWLATQNEWSLSIPDAIRQHPGMRGSVSQVVEKGYLHELIENNEELAAVLHFEQNSALLTVEDPQFLFYLRNIPWNRFVRETGFTDIGFQHKYDFALSFAGEDRQIAKKVFDVLCENEVEVFYDFNEQHRILANDIEEYLRPIYQSEAAFVVCIMGSTYPKKIWTKFESDQFRERFDNGEVIPVVLDTVPIGMFDEVRKKGSFLWNTEVPLDDEAQRLYTMLRAKLLERREANRAA